MVVELGSFKNLTSSKGIKVPERCETCHWFTKQAQMVNQKEYDGICKRFPFWVTVDCHHKCGEWKEDVKTN